MNFVAPLYSSALHLLINVSVRDFQNIRNKQMVYSQVQREIW